MFDDFYSAVKQRRTVYGITKAMVLSNEKILEVVRFAVKYTPTAFNSQSSRVVVLFGKHHDRLWDITKEALRKVVPAVQFSDTEKKINSFRSGYGSILYFEDQEVIENLQKNFPLYKDSFPLWSQQASGILQYIVWTSLAIEGFGVNLQHYNPLIDEEVKKEWSIPRNWKLIGQMPFGKPAASPPEKDFKPIDERVKVFE